MAILLVMLQVKMRFLLSTHLRYKLRLNELLREMLMQHL